MFMMQYLQNIKNSICTFINNLDKKKKRDIIWSFTLVFVVLTLIFTTYEIDGSSSEYIYPKGNNFDNFYYLIISFNWVYFFYMLDLIKYNLIFFISNLLFLFLNDSFIMSVEADLFVLNDSILNYGSSDIQNYVFYRKNENIFNLNLFYYEHFYFNFYKKFFFGVNLPIFFYFGLLFILTTIFSLVLLSYYGFYGAFFINLISIILF